MTERILELPEHLVELIDIEREIGLTEQGSNVLEILRASSQELHRDQVLRRDDRDPHAIDRDDPGVRQEQLLESRPGQHDVERHPRLAVDDRQDARLADERFVSDGRREARCVERTKKRREVRDRDGDVDIVGHAGHAVDGDRLRAEQIPARVSALRCCGEGGERGGERGAGLHGGARRRGGASRGPLRGRRASARRGQGLVHALARARSCAIAAVARCQHVAHRRCARRATSRAPRTRGSIRPGIASPRSEDTATSRSGSPRAARRRSRRRRSCCARSTHARRRDGCRGSPVRRPCAG